MLILDLFGGSGGWSAPWVEAGWKVLIVDPLAPLWTPAQHRNRQGQSNLCMPVQQLCQDSRGLIKEKVYGILAAPPCTEFAGSGSRWWEQKDLLEPEKLAGAIDNVRVMLRLVKAFKPVFWCAENPRGRMRRMVPEIGKWREHFDPCDFAGWIDKEPECLLNRYTKDTYLWGNYQTPERRRLEPVMIEGNNGKLYSPIHFATPGEERWKARSITPSGFAKAFFNANNPLS